MTRDIVRVDSGEEQLAYLQMHFGPQASWSVTEQSITVTDGETIEIATIRVAASGEALTVRFGPAIDDDDAFGGEVADATPSTQWLDDVLERATTFSAENPPHHPGTIARFPVPAAGYKDAISVPMALIAEDGGRAGIYAPPRLVALHRETLEPIGVGEYPGFDPEFWPPERLADWPLPGLLGVPQEQVAATIQRTSATWKRVLDAWFASDPNAFPHLGSDAVAANAGRAVLDTQAMNRYYELANPVFAKWLNAIRAS